jgi:hypothetical protein
MDHGTLSWLRLAYQPPDNKPATSNQTAVLFSQNKPVTSNQPAVLFSQNKSAPAISHQPNEQAVGFIFFAYVSSAV